MFKQPQQKREELKDVLERRATDNKINDISCTKLVITFIGKVKKVLSIQVPIHTKS